MAFKKYQMYLFKILRNYAQNIFSDCQHFTGRTLTWNTELQAYKSHSEFIAFFNVIFNQD